MLHCGGVGLPLDNICCGGSQPAPVITANVPQKHTEVLHLQPDLQPAPIDDTTVLFMKNMFISNKREAAVITLHMNDEIQGEITQQSCEFTLYDD